MGQCCKPVQVVAMKVLDRHLAPPFDDFWERFASEVPVPVDYIEKGHRDVFGSESYREGTGDLPLHLPRWLELPDYALSYHVAHELTHMILRERGYPRSIRGAQYPDASLEARVGGDLEEMVSHHALEEVLKPIPFDRSHIQRHLFETARQGLETSPVPEAGTPWWITWALRFCELRFLLPRDWWLRLEVVYDGRCPDIADKGRELTEIMEGEGYQTPDHTLSAMIRVRDSLGLKEADRCLVLDPRDGKVY